PTPPSLQSCAADVDAGAHHGAGGPEASRPLAVQLDVSHGVPRHLDLILAPVDARGRRLRRDHGRVDTRLKLSGGPSAHRNGLRCPRTPRSRRRSRTLAFPNPTTLSFAMELGDRTQR